MAGQKTAAYGSWKSPISSDMIVQGTISLVGMCFDGADRYWVEARPSEAGRNVLMRQAANGMVEEITPAPFNVRDRVHEYGGAPFVIHEGMVYFSNFADNLLYVRKPDGTIEAMTSDTKKYYADGVIDPLRNRLILVREDHTNSDIFAETTLVSMNADGSNEQIVVSGNDFYANPRFSPDGRHFAWLTWNHPNMPWDETELWVADVMADGSLQNERKVAGGNQSSVIQPVWSPDNQLYFVSDKSNWWNIMRLEHDGAVTTVCPMEAEFGSPSWAFGISDYAFVDPDNIICTYSQNGRKYLATLGVASGRLALVETEDTYFTSIHSNGGKIGYIGASPVSFPHIVVSNPDGSEVEVLKSSAALQVSDDYICVPESIAFPTEGGKTAYAIFYPPKNPDFVAPGQEKPPLLVHVHGGPTAASQAVLNLSTQYWTSRGIAVVDVNYGGSTGYGREYRDRLKGNWGIVDVDDSANAALYLAKRGDVDEDRLAIAGGSAGGYTTLASLVFKDVYRAGASHFGLSELEVFVNETHKFESRYMDGLLGPYPEAKDVYYNRSPINFTDQLSCPVIFFQGLDDKIVPPNQAELMVEALRKKGLPVAYVAFAGEGHGFRMSENIKRSLDGEFYFYSRVFGFTPADDIEPVQIDNM